MANGDRAPFLGGGSGSMHGPRGTATQKPGVSSQEGDAALSGGAGDPDAGPPGAGFYSQPSTTNKDYAGTQMAGISGPTKSGGDAKFAAGGTSPMCPNTGSTPAVGGRSGVGR